MLLFISLTAITLTIKMALAGQVFVQGPIDCAHLAYAPGRHLDLSSLNKEFTVKVPKTGERLRVNPCGGLAKGSPFCPKASRMCLDDAETWQAVANFGAETSYAVVNTDQQQVVLVFGNGTMSADGFPFTGMFRVVCDESNATGRQDIKLVEGHPPVYQLTLESALVCAMQGDDQLLPGGSLSWIAKGIATLLLLYLFLGSVYRAVVLGKRGEEIVPNHALWRDLFNLGREFASNLGQRLTGRRPSAGYQQL